MIQISSEKPMTLAEATAFFPGVDGKPVHYQTVYRWACQGLRGVRLETVFCGGRRCTTREAVQRFVEQITRTRDGIRRDNSSPSQSRRTTTARTRRILAEHGID